MSLLGVGDTGQPVTLSLWSLHKQVEAQRGQVTYSRSTGSQSQSQV